MPTNPPQLDFERLQTPQGDSDDGHDVLIEPSAQHWQALMDRNRKIRNEASFTVAGRSAADAVRATRERLDVTADPDQPILCCGHQPAFVHPGVWAKHVVVHRMSQVLGAAGIDIVVDNDSPASFALNVPVINTSRLCHAEDVSVVHGVVGSAYEGQAPLTREAISAWQGHVEALLGDAFPGTPLRQYFKAFREVPRAADYVDQHMTARHTLDQQWRADLTEVRASDAFGGEFVADVLLNAGRFATCYNEALADYRSEHKVRDVRRPLPDLQREGARIETALWVYSLAGRRRRLWIELANRTVTMFADAELIGRVSTDDLKDDASAALNALSPWVVRPRALTLTLWLRLLVCDLFVHGIGGAKYDRITDRIIERYYGCEPSAYTCVSATLRLPLPMTPVSERDVQALKRISRDLHYNPQRYLAEPSPELLAQRQSLIERSRLLRNESGARLTRRETFQAIRQVNAALVASGSGLVEANGRRLADLERQLSSNVVAGSREYFYLLQPQERLQGLATRLVRACEM